MAGIGVVVTMIGVTQLAGNVVGVVVYSDRAATVRMFSGVGVLVMMM